MLLTTAATADAQGDRPETVEAGSFPRLATVIGSKVRLRTGPSYNHFAFHLLRRGSELVVDGLEKADWYRIHVPPYVPVWIHGDYLSARPDGSAQVTGSRVRVRSTPGTKHAPIGVVEEGAVLRQSGKKDKSGKWVECFAPSGSKVYIHRNYVELKSTVVPSQVTAIVRGLVPGRVPGGDALAGTPGRTAPEAANPQPGIGPGMPAQMTPALRKIYDQYNVEKKKKPELWDFAPVLAQLESVRKRSEDLDEIDGAELFISWIQEQMIPIHKQFRKIEEERKRIADGKATPAEKREQDKIGIGQRRPVKKDREYLATGWVVAMGTEKKVDATHKLMKGNKLLFYIKSDQVNLDSYVNKRVGIQGVLEELPPVLGARLVSITAIKPLSR